MAEFEDITGRRFGRLLVLTHDHIHYFPSGGGQHFWKCECDCGKTTVANGSSLRRGVTKSCGCLGRERLAEYRNKHGKWGSKEYWAWALAKNRVTNPRNAQYSNYGGRGIRMSDEWLASFAQFDADMGPCPVGLTLDRIDNDGNYEKNNCRWASYTVQARNTRTTAKITHNGETLSFAEWSEKTGINVNTLRVRYHQGMRPPDLFRPIKPAHSQSSVGHAVKRSSS